MPGRLPGWLLLVMVVLREAPVLLCLSQDPPLMPESSSKGAEDQIVIPTWNETSAVPGEIQAISGHLGISHWLSTNSKQW